MGSFFRFHIFLTLLQFPFDYNAEVELINPVADTVATATFQGAEVDWYIKADDIVLKKGAAMNPQPPKKDAPPVK